MADNYLNWLRDMLQISGAGALTESTIKTGLSIAQGTIAMEIWNIVEHATTPEMPAAAGGQETTSVALAGRSGETTIMTIDDVVTLYYHSIIVQAGAAAANSTFRYTNGYDPDWNPILPILYGFPDVYHYIDSSDAGTAIYSRCKIGFLYIDTTKDTYWEILQGFSQIMG